MGDIDGNDLLRFLLKEGVQVQTFKEILPSLNDIFIQQVGLENIDPAVLNLPEYE